jgi:hypothetical protein
MTTLAATLQDVTAANITVVDNFVVRERSALCAEFFGACRADQM